MFTIRGVPYGQKVTQPRKKGQKKIQKINLKDWTKWNRKMGGRSFNITSGAFLDTLLWLLALVTGDTGHKRDFSLLKL